MKKLAQNLTLSFVSVSLTLVLLEIVVRLLSPYEFTSRSYPPAQHALTEYSYIHRKETFVPMEFDPELGYFNKTNINSLAHPAFMTKSLTNYKDGTRSNLEFKKSQDFNQPPFDPRNAILAVGDSFTQGLEVGNTDTWPALLERDLGIRVINGGVTGYSLMQSILAGERLIKQLQVKRMIISLIAEDIDRSEHSFRYRAATPYLKETGGIGSELLKIIASKESYYEMLMGTLKFSKKVITDKNYREAINKIKFELTTDHIRVLEKPTPEEKNIMVNYFINFGYSFLLMDIFTRISNVSGGFVKYGAWKRENNLGDLGICDWIPKLADFKKKNDIQIVFVLQYEKLEITSNKTDLSSYNKKNIIKARNVLNCAKANNIPAFDLYDSLRNSFKENSQDFSSLYVGSNNHMSAKGNKFIAELLKDRIMKYFYGEEEVPYLSIFRHDNKTAAEITKYDQEKKKFEKMVYLPNLIQEVNSKSGIKVKDIKGAVDEKNNNKVIEVSISSEKYLPLHLNLLSSDINIKFSPDIINLTNETKARTVSISAKDDNQFGSRRAAIFIYDKTSSIVNKKRLNPYFFLFDVKDNGEYQKNNCLDLWKGNMSRKLKQKSDVYEFFTKGKTKNYFCDLENGGWTLVATISKNNKLHASKNAVATYVIPLENSSSKFSDEEINEIATKREFKFVCGPKTIYIRNFRWHSTLNHKLYKSEYSIDGENWFASGERQIGSWNGFDNYVSADKNKHSQSHYIAYSTEENVCSIGDGTAHNGDIWAR